MTCKWPTQQLPPSKHSIETTKQKSRLKSCIPQKRGRNVWKTCDSYFLFGVKATAAVLHNAAATHQALQYKMIRNMTRQNAKKLREHKQEKTCVKKTAKFDSQITWSTRTQSREDAKAPERQSGREAEGRKGRLRLPENPAMCPGVPELCHCEFRKRVDKTYPLAQCIWPSRWQVGLLMASISSAGQPSY